ncbi:MAG: helix-turn-helix domain-containing protein, partial [Trichococcus flocculiformis]
LGKDDLLLNILFNNKSISINWLMNMNHHDSILYKILLTNNPLDTNAANFILFRNEQNEHIKQIINNMADEYFFPKVFSGKIISSYLPILIYELARSLPHEYSETFSKKDPFYDVLQLIDAEFTTLTLDAASKRLNFNKNYLSNMIKKRSGQTFTELLNEKRLLKANLLIESTEIPIQTILTEVGFSNKTYFYTCYKNRFHCLPSEVRKNGAASK